MPLKAQQDGARWSAKGAFAARACESMREKAAFSEVCFCPSRGRTRRGVSSEHPSSGHVCRSQISASLFGAVPAELNKPKPEPETLGKKNLPGPMRAQISRLTAWTKSTIKIPNFGFRSWGPCLPGTLWPLFRSGGLGMLPAGMISGFPSIIFQQ